MEYEKMNEMEVVQRSTFCVYCSKDIKNFICEDCLIESIETMMSYKNPNQKEWVLERLNSIRVPSFMQKDVVCNECNKNKVSICRDCFLNKFNGVLKEVKNVN